MSTNTHPFTTVTFEDGSVAVVQTDPYNPRLLEVIALFFNAAHARAYAEVENRRSAAEPAPVPRAPAQRVEPPAAPAELSPRQSAVFEALRARIDEHNQVAAKAADLATAAQIPLGSLHSVLQSLEKKQLIKTTRAGSARAPAVYQVF